MSFKSEYVLKGLSFISALFFCGIFFLILSSLIYQSGALSFEFLTTVSSEAGRAGGILEVINSSFLILSICLGVSVPLSIATAVFLAVFSEKNPLVHNLISTALDTLAATPSIVFGLFGYSFFVIYLGFGFSILAGGLTLAFMVLPFLIRIFEEGISENYRQFKLTGASLGLSRTAQVRRIILPLSTNTISAGLVLGIGRALSETAALLFTSGYLLRMPESVMDSGRSMSVHIFDLAMNVPGGNQNAYRTAVVLVVALIVINLTSTFLTRKVLGAKT